MAYQPGPSYRPQPGQPILNVDPHSQAMSGLQSVGRSSPMPPVPSVAQTNIGQPGQIGSLPGQQNTYMGPSGAVTGSDPNGSNGANGASPADKGPDYVYFERLPNQFSESTRGKATAAKMKLELYYKEAVEGVVGRKER